MDRQRITVELLKFLALQVVVFYSFRWAVKYLDPLRKRKRDGKEISKATLKQISGKDKLQLNEYEEIIATELILPENIDVSFKDIGGMEDIIHSIQETIILPLNYPEIFGSRSELLNPARGILLYGPPGCGKTMLAKAIAKESGAAFLNLRVSTLTEKWFGESQKLVKGLFTLAQKLEPCIIFIDEIDSFLRERQSNDHDVIAMMKAEFMSLWDGLATSSSSRVIIMGATNRPRDIDQAILRRMPKTFAVKVPGKAQREKILSLLLRNENLDEGFNIEQLSEVTEGMSGSDLKELCRSAAMQPVREFARSHQNLGDVKREDIHLRSITMKDFIKNEHLQQLLSVRQMKLGTSLQEMEPLD